MKNKYIFSKFFLFVFITIGVIFFCDVSLTAAEVTTNTHDIFGDGSAVATYKFDQNVEDLGGTYDGVTSGDPTYIQGVFNDAIAFDGSGDSVLLGNIPLISDPSGQAFTVNLWIKDISGYYILSSGAQTSSAGIVMHNTLLSIKTNTHTYTFGDLIPAATGDFIMLTLVFDEVGGIYKFYIDGVDTGVSPSISASGYSNAQAGVYLGRPNNVNSYFGNFDMDQLRIFNRALTSAEIATLYAEEGDEITMCTTGTLDDTCVVNTEWALSDGEVISGAGNLVIASGGNLTAANTEFFAISMDGDVTIQDGGTITGNLTTLTAANLDIQTGGSINVNGRGHAAENGPGAGVTYGTVGSGGGYGGNGGDYSTTVIGGSTYGSVTEPTDLGSGGGAPKWWFWGWFSEG